MSNNVGDGFFEDESDDEEVKIPKKAKKRRNDSSGNKKSKKAKPSLIDDAAEESGEEAGDPDEEEDDEEVNDYIRDGFVVDEDEVEVEAKKKSDDLEDSDDEDDDDEEEGSRRNRLTKKLRKLRQGDVLDEDDLALINEFRGEREREETLAQERAEAEARRRETVVAKSEAELRKGLFIESDDEDIPTVVRPKKVVAVERYDEDGMDDFIDDDIGDQGDIIASERRGGYDEDREGGVSEAQLNEASAIFGTDYLQFMGGDDREADEDEDELMGRPKYREAGVGVDMGSDEEMMSEDDDDDDLFGDEDDFGEGLTAQQKAEALRLRREKREMLKAERRRQTMQKKSERRKAQLRRAFEPVQLVENFCTERDDEIRRTDIPERFYDWTTPFHGADAGPATEDELMEATWIVARVPGISSEFHCLDGNEAPDVVGKHQEQILESVVQALRLMHSSKLEPPFIRRYRADVVTSPAVREALYSVLDEDSEWDRMLAARDKVRNLLNEMKSQATSDAIATAEDENIQKLNEQLQAEQAKVEQTMEKEAELKEELKKFDTAREDDDELFGGGDNEEVRARRCFD